MFGSQNAKSQTEIKPGPAFDPRTIPAHTMQDDLDVLSGKASISPSIPAEERGVNPGIVNKGAGSSPASSSGGSPFMESSRPTPVKMGEAKMPTKAPSNIASASRESMKSSLNKAPGIPVGVSNVPMPISPSREMPKPGTSGRLVGLLLGVLVLLVSLGGGYYFYMTRYNSSDVEVGVIPPENDIPEAPEVVPEVVVPEKFSSDKPNYLMMDAEEMTVADIQKLFDQKAIEIREDKKSVPIEFVITDANNNPIALKIFALLLKVSFSQKLLDNFKDDFSLFIFPDGANARLGINISPKDSVRAMVDIKAEEKTLVKGLEALFLGEVVKSQTVLFQDAVYGDTAIRYINLNDQKSLSVDYFRVKEQLIVTTSKNAAWAIIDKMKAESQK